MNQSKSPQTIVQQQLALDAYLSKLLDEVPDAVTNEGESCSIKPIGVSEEKLEQSEVIHESQVQSLQTQSSVSANLVILHPLSIMPDWTQHEFQALFFKVEHLILATPLTELSRTIKIERKPCKIAGQPSWFLGLLDDQDNRIGVLDAGQLVFGKSRGSQRDLETNPFKRVLITKDKRWGLACDEILSIGKLKPDKVRWRTSRQRKPWLIGTVIEELTAIIDLQQLVPHRRRPT
jgi:purine-binding chemotaxis protein CheW